MINTEAEYDAAVTELHALIDKAVRTEEEEAQLIILFVEIGQYEDIHYPMGSINTEAPCPGHMF